MFYEWIDIEEILGGVFGIKDKVGETKEFLDTWSTWLATIIAYVADFIKKFGAIANE